MNCLFAEEERCIAVNKSGIQCLRKRNKNKDYCGTHEKALVPTSNNPVKVEIEIKEIRGIPYYIDKQNRVYKHENIHELEPTIIGTYFPEIKSISFTTFREDKEKEKEKPSLYFCQTGILEPGEKYNQNLHNYSNTVQGRAQGFYTEAELSAAAN